MKQFIAHINENSKQSCEEHCKNTAQYAEECLDGIGLGNTAYLSGLLHDVGKYTDEFSKYITESSKGNLEKKGSIIHSFAGVKFILERYHPYYGKNRECSGWEKLTAEMIATAIGSHHGLFDELKEDGISALYYRCNKQPEYDERAIDAFLSEFGKIDMLDNLFNASDKEISSLASRCLELAQKNSNEARRQECFCFYLGLMQRLINSAVINGDRTDTEEFMEGISLKKYTRMGIEGDWAGALEKLENTIDSFSRNSEIQKARHEMSDICAKKANQETGVYRLNMPTGAGKTLSSLRYSLTHAKKHNKKRIFFVVPLLSVLDQNVDVIKNAIGNADIVLEHHSDVSVNDFNTEELKKYDILTETWDAPIVVTTFVQFLNALFDGKTSAVRRFHSLCNSIIVIDEVQNVPEKLISLFTLAINFLRSICNTTVVMCSATQPKFEDNVFNLITDEDIIGENETIKYNKIFKRTHVKYAGEMCYEELIEHAKNMCEKHGNVLIICNTKGEAVNLYVELSKIDITCIHLSTSLCMAHRKRELKNLIEILTKGEKVICVSTQLIEAGIDISFSSVIRISAGIDNVVQSAGRCNRHGENSSLAPVEVVSLKSENLSFLKEIDEGKSLTEELIAEYVKRPELYENDLISKQAVDFYYERKIMRLNNILGRTEYSMQNGQSLLNLLSINSGNYCNENCIMRQAFKTAGSEFKVFDNNYRTLIVPYNEEALSIINLLYSADDCSNWSLLKNLVNKAKPYMVQVFENQYLELKKYGAIVEIGEGAILILQQEYYDEKRGVTTPKDADVNKIDSSYIL